MPCTQCYLLRQVKTLDIPELIGYVPDSQSSHHPSHKAITNTGGCHGMGNLDNVPFASAHGHCTAAALSYIQWKVHHKFHVPHVVIEYLQQKKLQSLPLDV